MPWGAIDANATFNARLAAGVIRPAVFVYLNWPTGEIWASTHHKSVQTTDTSTSPASTRTWSGVGGVAFIRAPQYGTGSALVRYTIGYRGLPQGAVTETTQDDAIGARAKIWLGLFDDGWTDPQLRLIFIGHILTTGNFVHRRDEDGNWLTDASIEISNGRNPRRPMANHHSPETAEVGDTAWRLLQTAVRSPQ